MELPKKKPGRPTKYDPSLNKKVTRYALMGATNEEIAEFLEIDVSQLYIWIKKHPEFHEAILRGREDANADVALSLYKRATGSKIKSVKIFHDPKAFETACAAAVAGIDPDDIEARTAAIAEVIKLQPHIIKVPYTEEFPPDVKAAIFWLTNKRADNWKEKRDGDVNVNNNIVHNVDWEAAPGCDPITPAPEE